MFFSCTSRLQYKWKHCKHPCHAGIYRKMVKLNWLQKLSATHKLCCIHFEAALQTHQTIGVVAHVPERDEGQCDPTSICCGNLVLTGHHRGHCPPDIQIALLHYRFKTGSIFVTDTKLVEVMGVFWTISKYCLCMWSTTIAEHVKGEYKWKTWFLKLFWNLFEFNVDPK